MVSDAVVPDLLHNDRLDADAIVRADGTQLIVPRRPPDPYPERLTDSLRHWAGVAPERTYMAQRDASGEWRRLSYGQTLAAVRALASRLRELPLSAERPVVILSGNSLEHQLLGLAAMYAGVPYCPVSTAYSLVDRSLGKIRQAAELLTPGLVAAFGDAKYLDAVRTAAPADAIVVSDLDWETGRSQRDFSALCASPAAADIDALHDRLGPATIAKFLLTSGSTGNPKAVIVTHAMLCANQMMIRQALPFLEQEPPVLVDWLPWNHVFGGSHNVGIALANGGTYYIDEGRPSPSGIHETVRNLREIAPTVYFNVPKGYEELLAHLRSDELLRRSYLSRLRATFYAGASLAQPVWDALDELATASVGRPVPMLTGLGATETGPSVTFTTAAMGRAGLIGLPAPGLTVKLAPVEGKLEIRVKGPNVMPGYWRRPDLTASAFDAEGYYRLGDAVTLVDAGNAAAGLRFDGRLSEDFKLATGVWVSVGPLRMSLIHELSPLVQDVVVAGPERDQVTALILLDPSGCSRWLPALGPSPTLAACAAAPEIRSEIVARLRAFGTANRASSRRIVRAVLLAEPASLAHGEITDKGSINQRAVLAHRQTLVETLYAGVAQPDLLCPFEVDS